MWQTLNHFLKEEDWYLLVGLGVGSGLGWPQNYDNRHFEAKQEMTIIVISVLRSHWLGIAQAKEKNLGVTQAIFDP